MDLKLKYSCYLFKICLYFRVQRLLNYIIRIYIYYTDIYTYILCHLMWAFVQGCRLMYYKHHYSEACFIQRMKICISFILLQLLPSCFVYYILNMQELKWKSVYNKSQKQILLTVKWIDISFLLQQWSVFRRQQVWFSLILSRL